MSARENILARIRSANKVAKNPDVIGGTAVDRIKAHPSSPLPTLDWENENHFKLRCHELASSLDRFMHSQVVESEFRVPTQQAVLPGKGAFMNTYTVIGVSLQFP